MVEILTGHDIEVRFDRPCALQIDGETIPECDFLQRPRGRPCAGLTEKTAGVCIPPADGVSKKPRRVAGPRQANQIGSFSPAGVYVGENTAQSRQCADRPAKADDRARSGL